MIGLSIETSCDETSVAILKDGREVLSNVVSTQIAIHKNLNGVNGAEWIRVIYGLLISLALGFGLGYLMAKTIEKICKRMDRRKTKGFFKNGQIVGAASMAFMHGAQDGQKFIGVFLLGTVLANGITTQTSFAIPIWLMILCSAVMTLGTSIGGYKIIKTVGMGMVKLETYQGFAADLAGAICLMIASLFGIPVSTTHTKTTAIMGVGAARRLSNVNWRTVKEMGMAWILTFPGCGLLGFIVASIGTMIF